MLYNTDFGFLLLSSKALENHKMELMGKFPELVVCELIPRPASPHGAILWPAYVAA